MRTTSIVILAVLLFASTNALTAQNIIAAVNFARKNPKVIAQKIQAQYPNMRGTANDATCYSDAIAFLNAQAPLPPLRENLAADLSTWLHSRYCVQVLKTISHTGAGNSNPVSRLEALATGVGALNENIALTFKPNTVYPTAQEFIIMWITDCGVPNRGHRTNMFSTHLTHLGCGVFQGPMTGTWIGTVATCMGTNTVVIKPEALKKLAEAGLSPVRNGAGFTGV